MIVFVIKVLKVLIKEPKSKEQSRQTVAFVIRQNVIRNWDIWRLNERMWFNNVVSVYTRCLEISKEFSIGFLLADQLVSNICAQ